MRCLVWALAAIVAIVGCSSSSADNGGIPPRDRSPTVGLTGVSGSCITNAITDVVSASCTLKAEGAAPPPTLRMALVWIRFAPGKSVVVEYGERSTIEQTFSIELPAPPAPDLGLSQFVVYEDLNDNQHLDLNALDGSPSPDRVVGVARDAIIYNASGTPEFQIEEASPIPELADCVGAPCVMPGDRGSDLLSAGTPIQIVAVGDATGLDFLCDSFRPGRDDYRTAPACTGPKKPGDGVICEAGDTEFVGTCAPLTGTCEFPACTVCLKRPIDAAECSP